MLGAKETDFQKKLSRWLKKMQVMKKKLNRLLIIGGALKHPGDLEKGITENEVLVGLAGMRDEIVQTIQEHVGGTWIQ